MMRAQIDRDMNSLDDLSLARSEAGKKGGRPKKQTEAKKAIAFSESKKSKDKDKEEDKDKDYIKESIKRKGAPRFSPPTLDQVKSYCKDHGLNVNATRFFGYYQANGWIIGKTPMQDWEAALLAWNETEAKKTTATPFESSFDTDDFFEASLRRSYEEAVGNG